VPSPGSVVEVAWVGTRPSEAHTDTGSRYTEPRGRPGADPFGTPALGKTAARVETLVADVAYDAAPSPKPIPQMHHSSTARRALASATLGAGMGRGRRTRMRTQGDRGRRFFPANLRQCPCHRRQARFGANGSRRPAVLGSTQCAPGLLGATIGLVPGACPSPTELAAESGNRRNGPAQRCRGPGRH
jgi:hypothetical protein